MLILLPLILLGRILSIFTDFTFTDAVDYTPMASLVVGLLCAAMLGSFRRQSKPSVGLVTAASLLNVWPILPNIGLFFLALEFEKRTGTWPKVMVDDPKPYFHHLSPNYDAIFSLVAYLNAFSGAWFAVSAAVMFACWPKFSRTQHLFLVGITASSLLWVLIDPGNLYEWWLD